MDYNFEPAVKAKIKAVRARAYGLEIADGATAEQARKNADLIVKDYWRETVRKAEDNRNVKARTLRRIVTKELGDIL